MKLTWFGGTTLRIHIGGTILVLDAAGAPTGIDAAELVSGADTVIAEFGAGLAAIDSRQWKPRKPRRLLDSDDALPVDAWLAGPGAVLVDAVGEPPLLLVRGELPPLGRWAESAIVTLFGGGEQFVALGEMVLDAAAPRLLALAGDEKTVDIAISALRDRLDGTGLVALEAGMALEV